MQSSSIIEELKKGSDFLYICDEFVQLGLKGLSKENDIGKLCIFSQ
mgnify:CR=1 FL=1